MSLSPVDLGELDVELRVDDDDMASVEVEFGLPEVERNLIQQAISQSLESTAHLANLLPTGTVLTFQLLAPITTSPALTAGLLLLCGLSCVLLNFTDSVKDQKGNICYGFATFSGFRLIDGSVGVPAEVAALYKLKFIDFAHAFMSLLVFAAIAMFDDNTVRCFFPELSTGTRVLLPVGIAVICSVLFVAFPTKRHGIGFPISAES